MSLFESKRNMAPPYYIHDLLNLSVPWICFSQSCSCLLLLCCILCSLSHLYFWVRFLVGAPLVCPFFSQPPLLCLCAFYMEPNVPCKSKGNQSIPWFRNKNRKECFTLFEQNRNQRFGFSSSIGRTRKGKMTFLLFNPKKKNRVTPSTINEFRSSSFAPEHNMRF